MIKTCLIGLGKTGTVVAEQLLKADDFHLTTVMAKPNSLKKGKQLADFILGGNTLEIQSTDSLHEEFEKNHWNVAIDFTTAEASFTNAKTLAENGVHLVIGTTGFNPMQIFELKNLALKHKIGLVYAPNISLGINLLLSIVKIAARMIPGYDVEIIESHHNQKKDAPSGTAMKIAHEVATVKGNNHKYIYGRKGCPPRTAHEIGIHAIRAGGIVGVHQVLFAGESDEIEFIHRSFSRTVFAEGALRAARFIVNHKGFFSMEDVLYDQITADIGCSPIKTKLGNEPDEDISYI